MFITWKADVHSFNDVGISYFNSKLSAYSGDKYDFDSDKVVKRLREWLKNLKEYGTKYNYEEMRELFQSARDCSTSDEWRCVFQQHDDFLSDLDPDYWEWIYDCGDTIPWRIYEYLIGLKMASKQLKEKENKKYYD